jgi:hypothetical protein
MCSPPQGHRTQLLTLYTTPVVYLYLDRFQRRLRTRGTGHKQHEQAVALPAE